MTTTLVSTSPDPSGPALHAAVGELTAAAARVQGLIAAGSREELPEAAVAQATVGLAGVVESVAAATSTGLARVAGCGYPASEGFVTAASWWRARTRVSRDAASDQVRTARRLATHYEATRAAWAAGQITSEHSRVLATGIDGVLARLARRYRRDHTDAGIAIDRQELAGYLAQSRAELEGELLALARRWTPETLRVALARAREVADPDGASEQAMKTAAEASLRIEEVGDAAVITAQVSLEVAAMVRVILDHYRDTRYHHGKAASGADGRADGAVEVDPVTGDPITLTNAQRDAQALTDWATASLDRGLGSGRQGERAHLDITTTLTELATGVGTAILARTGLPEGVATTTIHGARRVGCDGEVRLVLTDGQYRDPHTGQVVCDAAASLLTAGVGILDYGRSERIVPERLRRALAVRDRGCAFPGCHRPPAHTQAHHVIHWADFGETSLANTVLLCSRHHHYVHEGGWAITARAGMHHTQPGYWQFTRPPRTLRP
jgi:hypothetical protein